MKKKMGKRPASAVLLCAVGFALLAPASCDDPTSAPGDILAVSSTVQDHFHYATVPARDIADPPPGGRTYTSTTANGHSHTVTVSETQLTDLQQPGAVVSVTSSLAGDPQHSHTFTFER